MKTPAASAEVESLAAEWVARRDGGLRAEERRDLHAWLAADPRHASAFAEAEAAWAVLNAPRAAGRGEAMVRSAKTAVQRRRRRRGLTAAGCVAAVVLLAALLPVYPPAAAPAAAAAPTVVKRPDRRMLPDGSAVELAAGAEYRLEFTPTRRAVELLRGEALFTVRSDPARPFVVAAGGVAVRAVGTEFAVRLGPEQVGVLVTEGRVAVGRPEAAAVPPTLVGAGNRLELASTAAADEPPPVPEPMAPAALATALAWRFQRVEFTATPLAEAVALMNAENVRQLALADAATGELRITGVFWTNDPAGFARLLASSLGLRTATREDGALVLAR